MFRRFSLFYPLRLHQHGATWRGDGPNNSEQMAAPVAAQPTTPPQRPQQVIESIRLKHGRRQLLLTSPEHWLGYDAVGTGQGGL